MTEGAVKNYLETFSIMLKRLYDEKEEKESIDQIDKNIETILGLIKEKDFYEIRVKVGKTEEFLIALLKKSIRINELSTDAMEKLQDFSDQINKFEANEKIDNEDEKDK